MLIHRYAMPIAERLKATVKLSTVLAPTLAGLVASTMLLVDYTRSTATFCEEGGGCDLMKRTPYAGFLGVPTPVFGVLAFLLFGTLALARGGLARSALLLVASIGTGCALFLLNVQRSFGVYCTFCVIADTCIVLVALAAAYRLHDKWDVAKGAVSRYVGAGMLSLAAIVPFTVGKLRKPVIPPAIAAELERTPKGMVTIVDFVDFECPWCRATNAELSPVLEAHKGKVRVVRKQVPLRMHPHALDAARAACCGEKLGNGDAMAEALFTSNDLSPEGCEKIAQSLGIDVASYRKCVSDPSTDERIKSDADMFRSSNGRGLPTIWVGDQKLEGAQEKPTLEQAIGDALARAGS